MIDFAETLNLLQMHVQTGFAKNARMVASEHCKNVANICLRCDKQSGLHKLTTTDPYHNESKRWACLHCHITSFQRGQDWCVDW